MSAIVVAYATKHGSTGEIANAIGQRLRRHGHVVDVLAARDVHGIAGYDAIIVGSAVYMFRWQKDAINLLKRHQTTLRTKPTWLFSSGPTGGSANADEALQRLSRSATEYPAPTEVARLMARIGARGHATFAGRSGDDMTGFFARWIPKRDWRDFETVNAWADAIDSELGPLALVEPVT